MVLNLHKLTKNIVVMKKLTNSMSSYHSDITILVLRNETVQWNEKLL